MRRLVATLFSLLALSLSTYGLEAQQKSKAVKNLENERQTALKAIEKTDKELKETKRNAANVKKRISLLEQQVKQRKQVISLLDAELRTLDAELDSMNRQAKALEKQEEKAKDAYARSIRLMQEGKSSTDKLLFLFSARDFDQGIRRLNYLSQYASAHKVAAADLKAKRQAVEEQRKIIAKHHEAKQQTKVTREQERRKLEDEESAKRQEAKQLSGKQQSLQKKLQKQQADLAALSRRIEDQIAREIAEAERKARLEREAAEKKRREEAAKTPDKKPATSKPVETERRAETKGGYAMDASERALSGSFAANRGKLPAPLRGRYTVAVPYGTTAHSENKSFQVTNTGIDLETATGTDASAVFDGEVTAVFVQPGYNTTVIVRHGNYLTVYANLIKVYVSKGQKVKTGTPIGRIFTDKSTNKTTLHFELWKERTRQNPSLWIR